MKNIILAIDILLLILASFSVIYLLIFSITALFARKSKITIEASSMSESDLPRAMVIIPAYKEDQVIVRTAELALRQRYPIGKMSVVVVADHLQKSTLWQLRKLPVSLIELYNCKSTKANAINSALDTIPAHYDMVVILDADNVMEENFLMKMGRAFSNGALALQGRRTAKNLNTPFAMLDAATEEINNHIFCKGLSSISCSSRLTGSGMAFEYKRFKKIMKEIDAVGGFDKELELKLISNNMKITYVENALVYDEKVSKVEVMGRQRTRWISSQFVYLKKYFTSGIRELLLNRNVDYFIKSLQLLILPRVFLLAVIALGFSFALLSENNSALLISIALLAGNLFAYLFAFPYRLLNGKGWGFLYAIPGAIVKVLRSVPSMLSANKQFIHTPHDV